MDKGGSWLDLAVDLVDEALMIASQSAPDAPKKQYLEEREAISTIETTDIREERFRQLDAEWAERLGIADALREVLTTDFANETVDGCVVKRVRAAVEEGALLEAGVLYLNLRADSLLSVDRLREIVGRIL